MQDWFMLISRSITNKQRREFLQLKNRNEAYYILKTLGLEKQGNQEQLNIIGQQTRD